MKALAAALLAALLAPAASISGILSGGNAHIVVRFAAEGTDVQIAVHGNEGLTLIGDKVPVSGRSVSKSERIAVDIPYQAGPDQSSLTVEVTGTFGGESKSVSQTFRVGTPNDDQRHRDRSRAQGEKE